MPILLIDDNPQVRDSLKVMLEHLSPDTIDKADILEADCKPAAIQLIRKYRPELIITDAKLLLLSEASVLEQLYGERNGRLIVTSSHDFILQAFSRGGIDVLLKPVRLEELDAALLGASGTNAGSGKAYSHLYQNQPESAQARQLL
ncbi:response regulator [Paenibacillus sp. MMS20-IR301]|uniref:response regulator n=1 Tax=Paenibacillus sp. MMS20-IR301 TaxID=2895946 RepID=UPI0028EB1498|nr:response regulator [Paenibacillus sp. MMS20-IR301]WNS46789.1 response regulator [Paenibacillus sp. MMS20-IR301]